MKRYSNVTLAKAALIIGVVGLIAIGVSHCSGIAEHRLEKYRRDVAQNNAALVTRLPEGCTLDFLGEYERAYKSAIPVVIVRCAAASTTTTNTVNRPGKYDEPNTTVRIQGQ